jgi:hypothetical protein
VLQSNCRQLGIAGLLGVAAERAKKGVPRVAQCVDALVVILREGQSLLAPACQIQ